MVEAKSIPKMAVISDPFVTSGVMHNETVMCSA